MAKRNLSRRFLPPDPHVAEPYRLTPKLALRCLASNNEGNTHAEFDSVVVYSAASVPPVTKRNAVAKS